MSRIVVYTTLLCPYGLRARALLASRGLAFETIDVTRDVAKRQWLRETTGRTSVPQIFIDDKPIGGFSELRQLLGPS